MTPPAQDISETYFSMAFHLVMAPRTTSPSSTPRTTTPLAAPRTLQQDAALDTTPPSVCPLSEHHTRIHTTLPLALCPQHHTRLPHHVALVNTPTSPALGHSPHLAHSRTTSTSAPRRPGTSHLPAPIPPPSRTLIPQDLVIPWSAYRSPGPPNTLSALIYPLAAAPLVIPQ